MHVVANHRVERGNKDQDNVKLINVVARPELEGKILLTVANVVLPVGHSSRARARKATGDGPQAGGHKCPPAQVRCEGTTGSLSQTFIHQYIYNIYHI